MHRPDTDLVWQAIRRYQVAYANAPPLGGGEGIASLQSALAHLHAMAEAAAKGWQPVSSGTALAAMELLTSRHNPAGELTRPLAMIVTAHLSHDANGNPTKVRRGRPPKRKSQPPLSRQPIARRANPFDGVAAWQQATGMALGCGEESADGELTKTLPDEGLELEVAALRSNFTAPQPATVTAHLADSYVDRPSRVRNVRAAAHSKRKSRHPFWRD